MYMNAFYININLKKSLFAMSTLRMDMRYTVDFCFEGEIVFDHG